MLLLSVPHFSSINICPRLRIMCELQCQCKLCCLYQALTCINTIFIQHIAVYGDVMCTNLNFFFQACNILIFKNTSRFSLSWYASDQISFCKASFILVSVSDNKLDICLDCSQTGLKNLQHLVLCAICYGLIPLKTLVMRNHKNISVTIQLEDALTSTGM